MEGLEKKVKKQVKEVLNYAKIQWIGKIKISERIDTYEKIIN